MVKDTKNIFKNFETNFKTNSKMTSKTNFKTNLKIHLKEVGELQKESEAHRFALRFGIKSHPSAEFLTEPEGRGSV